MPDIEDTTHGFEKMTINLGDENPENVMAERSRFRYLQYHQNQSKHSFIKAIVMVDAKHNQKGSICIFVNKTDTNRFEIRFTPKTLRRGYEACKACPNHWQVVPTEELTEAFMGVSRTKALVHWGL